MASGADCVGESWHYPVTPSNTVPATQSTSAAAPVQTVVADTITFWSQAFGWGATNALKNDVSYAGGEKPLVWDQFESVYMAAPLVSVV